MRTLVTSFALSAFCYAGLSAQHPATCPGFSAAAKSYIEANFAREDDKPAPVTQQVIPLTPAVSALQISVAPEADEANASPVRYVAFFAGKTQCEFVQQWDGEISEIIEGAGSKFVFLRTQDADSEERHLNFEVVTVSAAGTVSATRDQHGTEIHFSQTTQNRCEGKIGDVTQWLRDEHDAALLLLRQRHTERDAKCRVTEDSATYRYYRLKQDHWELDEGELGE